VHAVRTTVSTNACYGFTGSSASKLLLVELAEATIQYGARLLQQAAVWTTERFHGPDPFAAYSAKEKPQSVQFFGTAAAGSVAAASSTHSSAPHSVEVVYGDTDSLFIKMPGKSVAEAMELAHSISRSITDSLPHPVSFAFEKVYHPFLLQQNKKYAGRKFVSAADAGELEVKGMEMVRRDIVPLVRKLQEEVLHLLLMQRDQPAAMAYTKSAITQLLADQYPMSDLVITKALWRGTEAAQYGTKLAHVRLYAHDGVCAGHCSSHSSLQA